MTDDFSPGPPGTDRPLVAEAVLHCADPVASGSFFCALMGWILTRSDDGDCEAHDRHGMRVAAFRASGQVSGWTPHFAVRDAAAASEVAASLGATIVVEGGDRRDWLVADPLGARFGLQTASAPLERLAVYSEGIALVDLATVDGPRARSFYDQVCDWKTVIVDRDYEFFISGSRTIAGLWTPDGEISERVWGDIEPGWSVYLGVDDCDRLLSLAVELGGRIVVPTEVETPSGSFAVIRDPEGSLVGFSEVTDDDQRLASAKALRA